MAPIRDYHLARLFLVGLVILALIQGPFGGGLTSLLPNCPIRWISGVPCPGCGMTRACLALGRGDLLQAWVFHPMVFPLVALAVAVGVFPHWIGRQWQRLSRRQRALLGWGVLVFILVLWGVRLAKGQIP